MTLSHQFDWQLRQTGSDQPVMINLLTSLFKRVQPDFTRNKADLIGLISNVWDLKLSDDEEVTLINKLLY